MLEDNAEGGGYAPIRELTLALQYDFAVLEETSDKIVGQRA